MNFIAALLFIVSCTSEKYIIDSNKKIYNSTLLFELDNKYISLVDSDEIFIKKLNINNYTKDEVMFVGATESLEKFYPGLWGLDSIDRLTDKNYNYDYTGKGVTVYVVDTGISNHIEFVTNNKSRLTGGKTFSYGTKDYYDCHGHGTHVASILGGNICGVAKEVNIISVRVFDCNGSGRYSELLNALNWISKQKKGIINMSLTGVNFYMVNDVINSLVKKGFIVVTAAGNYNADACNYSPASSKSAITVGCMGISGAHCWHSNEGSCVTLFAPGGDVLGANLYGGYVMKSGTSMASPHVAGIAAQIRQKFPKMKPVLIKKVILNNAAKGTLSLQMASSPNLSARLLRY